MSFYRVLSQKGGVIMTSSSQSSASQRVPEQGMVKLCGVAGCCPSVDFSNPEKVILKDDFGGQVELTRAQWKDLNDKFGSNPGST